MVFTMLQCSNTRWTRLLELGFISKICLDEWNSLSLMIENLYPCSLIVYQVQPSSLLSCLARSRLSFCLLLLRKVFQAACLVSSAPFLQFFLFFPLNYVFNTFSQKDEHLTVQLFNAKCSKCTNYRAPAEYLCQKF